MWWLMYSLISIFYSLTDISAYWMGYIMAEYVKNPIANEISEGKS